MSYPGTTQLITLYSPLTLENGSMLETVKMREPTVSDRISMAKDLQGVGEEQELRMLATLCNLSPEELMLFTAADYIQIQDAFNVFMLPPDERAKAQSGKD